MPAWALALMAVVIPTGGGILAMLYRIGNLMGRIQTTLEDHERRIDEMMERIDAPRFGYPPRRRER